MRVLFACTQGAGHFNPMVPFVEACLRGGHEILVVGPPPLAATAERACYAFRPGATPPDEELGPVWGRVPNLTYEEAEQVVIGEIFATLNVRAMLPAMREAFAEWRPDVVLREPAEFASAIVAEETGVPHVQVGIGLIESHMQLMDLASDAVDGWRPGLTERIAATPYLTLFPASLEDPDVAGPALIHRFRDPAADRSQEALPDWWEGDQRPLVYVTFGSVTAGVPTAAPIYEVALEAVADLPARVLLTTGAPDGASPPPSPGPHVHVTAWVPQGDVLPHARVVVCHGGSGTTMGALSAGVPLVITPLFADQPQNARRVAAVGAGLAVGPSDPEAARSAIDPATLRDAIVRVLEDDGFARAAREIADEISELPAADAALEVLEALA